EGRRRLPFAQDRRHHRQGQPGSLPRQMSDEVIADFASCGVPAGTVIFLKCEIGLSRSGNGKALPLPLWERVGVRGYGLTIDRNPSPGSHLTMRRSRSVASASFFKNGRRRRPLLSHKGRGEVSLSRKPT